MTSPPPARGTARYRCDTCGKDFGPGWYRLARLLGSLIHTDDRGRDCLGEIEREAVAEMPIARDDRAGVTLAIGVQPVGGDELVAAGPGEGLGQADAGGDGEAVCGHENNITTQGSPRRDSVHARGARSRMHAGSQGGGS